MLVHLDVPGTDAAWGAALLRLSGSHPERETAAADMEIVISPLADWTPSTTGELVQPDVDTGGRLIAIRLERIDLRGELRREGGRWVGRFDVDASDEQSLTVVIRSCLAVCCEERGELLLHASGVRRDGDLWIFFGPSGAGKSTIAHVLNGGGQPFASDRVVVRRRENREIWAHSTPFSDRRRVLGAPSPGPIRGLCYISQSPTVSLRPLDVISSVRHLLAESLILSRRTSVLGSVLDLVGDLVERNMCYRLEFREDPSFWSLIDAAEKSGKPR